MSANTFRISDLSDPRLDPYRNLKDRELAAMGGLFLAEGEHLLLRLNQSDFEMESVLLAERRCAELAPVIRPGVSIYVLPDERMKDVIGYKFHSGVIACGRLPVTACRLRRGENTGGSSFDYRCRSEHRQARRPSAETGSGPLRP